MTNENSPSKENGQHLFEIGCTINNATRMRDLSPNSTDELLKELLRKHGSALHVDLVATIAHQVYGVPASPSTVERACRRLAQNGVIVRKRRGVYAFDARAAAR